MRFWAYSIVAFAAFWPAYRAVTEANDFWTDDHNLIVVLFWTVGTGSSLLVQHGKNLLKLLARFSRLLSVGFRRVSYFFEDTILSWDNWFPPIELSNRRITNEKSVDPIKASAFTSTRPTFPWPVGATLIVLAVLAVAAFSLGPFGSRSPQTTTVAHDSDKKAKSDRLEIPTTFADRFTLPQDCMGCGGPDVELVPMPKPNPLKLAVPFPRPRP